MKLAGRLLNRLFHLLDLHLTRYSTLRRLMSIQNRSDEGGMRSELSPGEIEKVKRELAKVARWYHRFEIFPGIYTPGQSLFVAKSFLDSHGIPQDLTGKTALDIGAWDGPMTFELERRGANTTALDIQDPKHTGFNVAKKLLGSKARYFQARVYDLSTVLKGEMFDIIAFLGVFYHLKDPIEAFEQIARVLKPDGLLLLEGEVFVNYAENLDGSPAKLDVREIAGSDIPLTLCYPGRYKNASNWFVPNIACLKSWLLASGLELQTHFVTDHPDEHPPQQRMGGVARKIKPESVEEHPVW